MSAPDRGEMLDRADKALSIRRQCALLCVARSGVYRAKRPANDNDLILMRRIDELFMAYPFYGSRRMTLQLRSEGHDINRKRVQRIMRTMGIVALGPKPNTSKPAPGHKIYPYLLRGLKIARPNHVWCADITYIPIGRGFLYLVAWRCHVVESLMRVRRVSQLKSCGGDDFAPRLHGRCPEGSVRSCRCQMALDVEGVIGGCVG